MGRLDGQRAVHIDRESVMSGDKALFLDLTDKVEDLLVLPTAKAGITTFP